MSQTTYTVTTNPKPGLSFVEADFNRKLRSELAKNPNLARYAEELSTGKPIEPVPKAMKVNSVEPKEPKPVIAEPNSDPAVLRAIEGKNKGDPKFPAKEVDKLVAEKRRQYDEDVLRYKRQMAEYTKERTAHVQECNEVGKYTKLRDDIMNRYDNMISVIVSTFVAKSEQDRLIWDKIPGAADARAARDPSALIKSFITYMNKEANSGCNLVRLVRAIKKLGAVLESHVKNGPTDLDDAADTIEREFDDFHDLYMKVCSNPEGRGKLKAASLLLTLDRTVHASYLQREMPKFRSEEHAAGIDEDARAVAAQARLTLYASDTVSAEASKKAKAQQDQPPPNLNNPSVSQAKVKDRKKDGQAPTGNKAGQLEKSQERSKYFCQSCKDAGRPKSAFLSHNSDQCKRGKGEGGDKKRLREEAQVGTTDARGSMLNPPVNPNNLPEKERKKLKKQMKSALTASRADPQGVEFHDSISLSEEDLFSSRDNMSCGTFSARRDRKEASASKEGASASLPVKKHHKTLDFGAQASIARGSSLTDIEELDEEEIIEGIGGDVVYTHRGKHKSLGVMCLQDDEVTNDLIAPIDLELNWNFVGSETSITGKDSAGRDVVALGAVLYRDRNGQYPDARFERAPEDSPNRGLLVYIDREDTVTRK